jgi:CSLREA domain-containing protein
MINTTENRATTAKVMALGLLLAALMAASLLAASQARASTTFTVNSTEDHSDAILTVGACDTGYQVPGSGGTMEAECTLRAAMEQANHTPGADTINFSIAGSGVKTISPESALPIIAGAVSINGYSQPGAKPNQKAVGSDAVLKVELSGANAPSGTDGLAIGAANSIVKGLVINRWGDNSSSENAILISGSGATGNRVVGNYIGTDASGTQAVGNAGLGVYVSNAPNNTIGGATAGERNVISGNDGNGVLVAGADTTGNKVMGNYIGADKNGVAVLGNSANGVYISGPNNTVGSTTSGGRNTISGNEGSGVSIYGATAAGNRALQNSIFANGGLGIDLGDDGLTANDPGDADTGPNNLQNKPVINSARTGSLKTTIKGSLNSTPNKTFAVRFFSNPAGGDEGKTFIGQKSVTTNGSGNVAFSFSPAQKVGVGRTVTATATNPAGSTSEFSAPRTVASS